MLYPGLKDHPGHELAAQQMRGFGGMMSVRFHSVEHAKQICLNTRLICLAESLGGVESLVNHPAIMTHASVPRDLREKGGVTDSLIRLSVGVENVEDLIADLDQAIG